MSRRSHHPIKRHARPRHPDAKRTVQTPDRPDFDAAAVDVPDALDVPDAVAAPEPSDGIAEAPAGPAESSVRPPDPALRDEASLADEPGGSAEPVPSADVPVTAPIGDHPGGVVDPAVDASTDVPVTASVSEPASSRIPDIDDAMPAARPAPEPALPVAPVGPPGAATAPQLRRFIKSRSYIPMHELRRRFGISIEDDDVAAIDVAGHRVFVGLPAREGELLGELLRAGDIGYEVSHDPVTPVIVGVFPIRPVTRG